MRVSNWVDLVCARFDEQYPWGQGTYAGEPINSAGRLSLRALYAAFIDAYLSTIEAEARTWSARPRATTPGGTRRAMTAGPTTGSRPPLGRRASRRRRPLRFPRPAGTGPSPYGAYANKQFTLDGQGN